ncbi:MAG: threonine ammonia-lyase, partial [Woeseiaceae bacterium]
MTTLADIEAAAKRIREVVVETPLLQSAVLDEQVAGSVLLKPECFQRTGSFKMRGAYNMLSQLTPEAAARGAVAWSSGNHAQGVAAAGSMLGIHTAIVMPEDAPRAKLENTRRLGGEVITFNRYTGDREEIARGLAAERDAVIVPSYEHQDIIAGQGTVGLEIAKQSLTLGMPVEQVIIPCGGGGLTSGSAVA